MRYAIISDIHGNSVALEKVMGDIRSQNIDKILCLGDVVGYGPNPNKCLKIVRKKCDMVLLGNHEAGVCGRLGLDWYSNTAKEGILRDRRRVSNEDKSWMRSLQYVGVVEDKNGRIMCAHGTPGGNVENFDYILSGFDAGMAMPHAVEAGCNVLFVGHTHEACLFESPAVVNGGPECTKERFPRCYSQNYVEKSQVFGLKKDLKYVVNVGSVGYPRMQRFTCYAIYDSDRRTVEHRVMDFDFFNYVIELHAQDIKTPEWLESHVRHLQDEIKAKAEASIRQEK